MAILDFADGWVFQVEQCCRQKASASQGWYSLKLSFFSKNSYFFGMDYGLSKNSRKKYTFIKVNCKETLNDAIYPSLQGLPKLKYKTQSRSPV